MAQKCLFLTFSLLLHKTDSNWLQFVKLLQSRHYLLQCFSTAVLRRTYMLSDFLGLLPNLKMSKKVCKISYIFNILVSFLHLGVPPNLFSKLECWKLKKVENHWSIESSRPKWRRGIKIYFYYLAVQQLFYWKANRWGRKGGESAVDEA